MVVKKIIIKPDTGLMMIFLSHNHAVRPFKNIIIKTPTGVMPLKHLTLA